MSITQTALVFVGIPLLVVLTVYGAVYGTAARRVSKRYRPGRPFTFAPVWFLAAPDQVVPDGRRAEALPAGGRTAALPGPLLAQEPEAQAATHGETGGASDSW